jgi:hypothetical protein
MGIIGYLFLGIGGAAGRRGRLTGIIWEFDWVKTPDASPLEGP